MTRRLLNLLTAASLLLCVAYLAAWWWPREGDWPIETKTLAYTRWRIHGLTITGSSVWLDWVRWSSDDGWLDEDFSIRSDNYWERCENQDAVAAARELLPPRGLGTDLYGFRIGTDPGGRSPDRSWEWWRFRWDWYEDAHKEILYGAETRRSRRSSPATLGALSTFRRGCPRSFS